MFSATFGEKCSLLYRKKYLWYKSAERVWYRIDYSSRLFFSGVKKTIIHHGVKLSSNKMKIKKADTSKKKVKMMDT